MPSHCFAPGCTSGYESTVKKNKEVKKRNPSLFSAPKDDLLLEKWRIAIPRADRLFSFKDKLCELHFDETQIVRAFTHPNMPDGSTVILDRDKPCLKAGAIPTLFPNLPECFSKKAQRRKASVERVPAAKLRKLQSLAFGNNNAKPKHKSSAPTKAAVVTEKQWEEKDSEFVSETYEQDLQEALLLSKIDYEGKKDEEEPSCDPINSVQPIREESYLSDSIKSVTLPSHLWTIHATSNNYVMCARWNEQCLVERRVVIKDDLSIIVFLHNLKLQKQYEKITSVSDLSSLLKKVDKYVACKYINENTNTCEGIVTRKQYRSVLCNECKLESRRHRNQTFKSKDSFKRKSWYERIVTERREYACLKEEVAEIKKQIKNEKLVNMQLSKLDETLI